MKIARLLLVILSFSGLLLSLVALFTNDILLGLIGSLSAFLFCAFQLCLTIRKKKSHVSSRKCEENKK